MGTRRPQELDKSPAASSTQAGLRRVTADPVAARVDSAITEIDVEAPWLYETTSAAAKSLIQSRNLDFAQFGVFAPQDSEVLPAAIFVLRASARRPRYIRTTRSRVSASNFLVDPYLHCPGEITASTSPGAAHDLSNVSCPRTATAARQEGS